MHYHRPPGDECSAIAGQAILDVERVGRVIGRNLASYSAGDPAAMENELKSILDVLTERDSNRVGLHCTGESVTPAGK